MELLEMRNKNLAEIAKKAENQMGSDILKSFGSATSMDRKSTQVETERMR